MKILAVGDFHGKFPNKIKKYANYVDYIFCTGDLSDRKERKYIFKHMDELESGIPLIEFVSEHKLSRLIDENIMSMEYVVNKLDELEKLIYIVPGNSDFTKLRIKNKVEKDYGFKMNCKTLEGMIEKTNNLNLMFYSIKRIKNFDLIGFSDYNYLKKPFEVLERKFAKTRKNKTILLTHETPYKIKLDKVNYPGSPAHGKNIGKKEYNKIIKKYNPLIHICGHMHENQGETKIKRTKIINPGYGGIGEFAIIDMDKNINVEFFK